MNTQLLPLDAHATVSSLHKLLISFSHPSHPSFFNKTTNMGAHRPLSRFAGWVDPLLTISISAVVCSALCRLGLVFVTSGQMSQVCPFHPTPFMLRVCCCHPQLLHCQLWCTHSLYCSGCITATLISCITGVLLPSPYGHSQGVLLPPFLARGCNQWL